MAARGTITKQKIMKTILKTFPGSFLYNGGKEVRINDVEDGEPIQIKLTFTAAKVPVVNEAGADEPSVDNSIETAESPPPAPNDSSMELTKEEEERLKFLLNELNLH